MAGQMLNAAETGLQYQQIRCHGYELQYEG